MKHHGPDRHLTDDELLRAMVDPSDLDPARQAHLTSCRDCRGQTADLTDHLRQLGRMARKMAPEPRKSFRLPVHDAPAARWFFKPGWALAFLGILVFAVTLWGPRFTSISQPPTPVAVQYLENDARLMEEIDMLVEDALPAKYQQLAALSDDRSVDDLDAFMDWMVPSPGEADDLEHPAAPEWGGLPQPLAPSASTVHPERETV